ncbi:SAM-dependent methyltransferase [Candidatus Magnetomorum sp. HK-1]|nr:SAM-dependent methyltransferase [Candidatus Magnetomorum sp. HK-1]
MKKRTADLLICPNCLPKEFILTVNTKKEKENDIVAGFLECKNCKYQFQIKKGIALLIPNKYIDIDKKEYETDKYLMSYLWAHYADLYNDPEVLDSYKIWSSYFNENCSSFLDIGCATGRLCFEMSTKCEYIIGLDRSIDFIKQARNILKTKKINFCNDIEGDIKERHSVTLPLEWKLDNIDFIVGDALALPFPKSFFNCVSSLNIIDKVIDPLKYLEEICRVSMFDSYFLFSDPFSWSEEFTKKEKWLGGITSRGYDNIISLLKKGLSNKKFNNVINDKVKWKIRIHINRYEYIKSHTLLFKCIDERREDENK